MNELILIVGGAGEVGARIAALLARWYPGGVVVAGRRLDVAQATAQRLGDGVSARRIDIADSATFDAALSGVATVVSCIDQPRRLLFRAALDRGLRYTDITPHLSTLGGDAVVDELHARAHATGARLVLGTGMAPGISSVLARVCSDQVGGARSIEVALLLGSGDAVGPASTSYLFEELREPTAMTRPRRVRFPDPIGVRSAYVFPFSDTVFARRTLGVERAISRLALEPPWLGAVLAGALRVGGRHLLASPRVRHGVGAISARRRRAHPEANRWALVVEAARDGITVRRTLQGTIQAQATAVGAALTARALHDGEVSEPGAWCAEQVLDPTRFLTRLEDEGLRVAEV